jgi:organic radical activating enzyme
MFSKMKKLYNFLEKGKLHFQIHVNYNCNLKCKGCSHFSSISEVENLEIEEFEHEIAQIAALCRGKNLVRHIDLLGGEPLLHPDITQFLTIARRYFKNAEINLQTNGILLTHMNDDFWSICQNNNIDIAISNYPIDIKIDEIKAKAQSNNVYVSYNEHTDGKMFGHFRIDVTGSQNGEENARLCYEAKNCNCLDHGKMYVCYLPPCIHIFNRVFNMNVPIAENDFIDIYKVKNIEEIFSYLRKPMPFCNYCNLKGRDGMDWGISKKSIEEWI